MSYLEIRSDTSGKQVPMREKRERWMELAELASTEQDPNKLIELVREINQLLEEKQNRLRYLPSGTPSAAGTKTAE